MKKYLNCLLAVALSSFTIISLAGDYDKKAVYLGFFYDSAKKSMVIDVTDDYENFVRYKYPSYINKIKDTNKTIALEKNAGGLKGRVVAQLGDNKIIIVDTPLIDISSLSNPALSFFFGVFGVV